MMKEIIYILQEQKILLESCSAFTNKEANPYYSYNEHNSDIIYNVLKNLKSMKEKITKISEYKLDFNDNKKCSRVSILICKINDLYKELIDNCIEYDNGYADHWEIYKNISILKRALIHLRDEEDISFIV